MRGSAWIFWGAVAVGVAGALVLGTVAMAGKPPPPPPVDSGIIYFAVGTGSSPGLYSMGPDGSDKTYLTSYLAGHPYEPSESKHYCSSCGSSVRWFLRLVAYGDGSYPNGLPRGELHAMCEAGHLVRLTEAFDLEPDNEMSSDWSDEPCYKQAYPRWTENDTVVSYMGKRWKTDADGNWVKDENGKGIVDEYGLYGLEIAPDSLSSHDPARPAHLPITLDLYHSANDWNGGNVWSSYDWSPDGTEIVYQRSGTGNTGLWYACSPNWTPARVRTSGFSPRWSPDGEQILFRENYYAIYRMDPDPASNPNGTVTLILQAPPPSGSMDYWLFDPRWSPSGTHIAYVLYGLDSRRSRRDIDICRATVSGGDITDLTKDLSADAGQLVLGWR